MTTEEIILKIILPCIAAILGGGSVAAVLQYKLNKPKSAADTKQVNADATVTFADGWAKYAKNLEVRLNDMDQRNADADKRYAELQDQYSDLHRQVDQKDEEHKKALELKDQEIDSLRNRVTYLETELAKYQQNDPHPVA